MAKGQPRSVRGGTVNPPQAEKRLGVARSKRRRTWAIRPTTRPHSTSKGKKGYDRSRDRTAIRDESDAD